MILTVQYTQPIKENYKRIEREKNSDSGDDENWLRTLFGVVNLYSGMRYMRFRMCIQL